MITQKLLDEFRELCAAGKINLENTCYWKPKYKKIPFKIYKTILEEEHEKKNQERRAEGNKEATQGKTEEGEIN